MKIIAWIKAIFDDKNDPIKHCEVYKNIGCAHVDGILCDLHNCDIRKEYIEVWS